MPEEAAGRILFRNFGMPIPGGILRNLLRLKFKNTANTSVVMPGGSLLALWEGGLPHRLDPETLETLGAHDYGACCATAARFAFLLPSCRFLRIRGSLGLAPAPSCPPPSRSC